MECWSTFNYVLFFYFRLFRFMYCFRQNFPHILTLGLLSKCGNVRIVLKEVLSGIRYSWEQRQ